MNVRKAILARKGTAFSCTATTLRGGGKSAIRFDSLPYAEKEKIWYSCNADPVRPDLIRQRTRQYGAQVSESGEIAIAANAEDLL